MSRRDNNEHSTPPIRRVTRSLSRAFARMTGNSNGRESDPANQQRESNHASARETRGPVIISTTRPAPIVIRSPDQQADGPARIETPSVRPQISNQQPPITARAIFQGARNLSNDSPIQPTRDFIRPTVPSYLAPTNINTIISSRSDAVPINEGASTSHDHGTSHQPPVANPRNALTNRGHVVITTSRPAPTVRGPVVPQASNTSPSVNPNQQLAQAQAARREAATQRNREYRHRHANQRLERAAERRAARPAPMSGAERIARLRERYRAQAAVPVLDEHGNYQRPVQCLQRWAQCVDIFIKKFYEDEFGFACGVCDRLWFRSDLSDCTREHAEILAPVFGVLNGPIKVCANCKKQLGKGRIPNMSKTNGFRYPPKPNPPLPPLDAITARLISPRIPFMSIRRLRRQGQYSIIGQVINVPVDVDTMVRSLPRRLDGDYSINVAFKRNLCHKSHYLVGFVKKNTIKAWLDYLIQQPLYRNNRITIDMSVLDERNMPPAPNNNNAAELIEDLPPNAPANDHLLARQHTVLWNENSILEIAPGQRMRPLNLIFDHYSEEMSFPGIYYGQPRTFNQGVRQTPYTISTSEIRRSDRRGAVPDHVLYMAMKNLRIRLVENMRFWFKANDQRSITREQIESREFLNQNAESNFAFLKSLPNSGQYWQARKKDVFAMMRQLGKPTLFMTMSASETDWFDLLCLLHKLSDSFKDIATENLTASMKAHLVNEDPVTCCIYFKRKVDTIMNQLRNSKTSPFGKYYVVEDYMRFEMQHRGSVHVHTMLWLASDPKEPVSENMPETIKLITDLFSVDEGDAADDCYEKQRHSHTFTCTKRGESKCRFNIPYWPMGKTMVLLPMPDSDTRKGDFQRRASALREKLENVDYDSIDNFLATNNLTVSTYLCLIKSTLQRPTIYFKRNMGQIFINTFNPWVSGILASNMDIQFILDEYSCATYVLDYVNKSNRGTSNLHRELNNLRERNPTLTHNELMKMIAIKTLNTVEMCAQEASWTLLRYPMSKASISVIYIPTVWPGERQKSYKSRAAMNRENLGPESTDIWTKNIIQKYEDRPEDLINLCLADFAAWFTETPRNENQDEEDDGDLENEGPNDAIRVKKRKFARVIRSRQYDPEDTRNYKREMVTLYIPFGREARDVIDRDRFISIYNERIDEIARKKAEYVKCSTIEEIANELARARQEAEEELDNQAVNDRRVLVREILQDEEENFDDFEGLRSNVIATIRQRTDIMPRERFIEMMRATNERQREIVLEFIHRLTSPNENQPIQIFFTGPAGCGKTYTLKLIMDVINKYGGSPESQLNSYIACASTGKAAVNLGGTTVHGAFRICVSRQREELARETVQELQNVVRGVKAVIVDEVSMVGTYVFNKVNARLQQMTGEWDRVFGGLHMVFCGDLRQLPPVKGKSIFLGDTDHLQGAALWQQLDYYNLTQVMRQTDVPFATAVTKVGEGLRFTETETQMMTGCFRTVEWTMEQKPSAVRLFLTNKDVDSYNMRALQDGIPHEAKDQYLGRDEQFRNARERCHRMPPTDTGNLPWFVMFKVGSPYLITTNIDIDDRLVNGSIGTLRYLEELPRADDADQFGPTRRVWLEFENRTWGSKARSKLRSAIVNSRGAIHTNWTPISCRSATFKVPSTQVKCRRVQFPLVSALAMTIHKSQGGTFDEIVLDVDKNHAQQLHYVGISRVTSLQGLFLTNKKNEFIYHHGKGCDGGLTRLIREEYLRLRQHPLVTLSQRVTRFCQETQERSSRMLVCTINATSLVDHHRDITTDSILKLADILVITETWMSDSHPVEMEGYTKISASYKSTNYNSNPGNSANAAPQQRTAGGVAIYVRQGSTYRRRCLPTPSVQDQSVGDCALMELKFDDKYIIIAGVYIHPRTSKERVERYLTNVLEPCSLQRMSQRSYVDTGSPQSLIITGDFNSNVREDDWIPRFMNVAFGASYIPVTQPTTTSHTVIDLTFVRDLRGSCMPYVSYFTYHRPLFNKIFF